MLVCGKLSAIFVILPFAKLCVAQDFPSLISANASLAIVLDREYLGDEYQKTLDDLKDYMRVLVREELKQGGVVVYYYSWTAINLKREFTGLVSVASCADTWALFARASEERLAMLALTSAECPRLPSSGAVTIPLAQPGDELPQLLLDLRVARGLRWKSAVILHDTTLNRDSVSRVVQALTAPAADAPPIAVSVFKVRRERSALLRRKEVERVLSRLPRRLGEKFITVVRSEVATAMLEAARARGLVHTLAHWLFVVAEAHAQNDKLREAVSTLREGENLAFLTNDTDVSKQCKLEVECFASQLVRGFVLALGQAVRDELDVAAQVSDEEWEAIRPTKTQRRDFLLKHIQLNIAGNATCGSCLRWRARSADTWGAAYVPTATSAVAPLPSTTEPPTPPGPETVNRSKENANVSKEAGNSLTSLDITEFQFLQVGFWHAADGLTFTDELFPHTVHGFRGKPLPIITYHNPPWTILQANESGIIANYSGLVFDIITQLAKNKNFTINLMLTNVQKLIVTNITTLDGGTSMEEGEGGGLDSANARACIAAAAGRKVAIAAAAFTRLPQAPSGINYTLSISTQPYTFLVARPRELGRALLFMSPFTADTWLCLGFAVLLMGPVLYIVHRLSPVHDSRKVPSGGGLSTIHNCLWYVYGALLQQGGMYLPLADSGRLVIGTWWLVVLVVVTTYSGNLVAFLTFPKVEIAITTVTELVAHADTVSWSMREGTYLEKELTESDESSYRRLASQAQPWGGARAALKRARRGNHVLLDWKMRLQFLMREDHLETDTCAFALGMEEFMEEQLAMIMPEGSPYLPVFNEEIKRMHQMGLTHKWLSKYLPRRDRCWKSSATLTVEANNHTVNINDMQGSFFVLLLGFLISSLVLFVEWIYKRQKKKQEEKIIKPFVQ